jgi:signal transduction histidine kinase
MSHWATIGVMVEEIAHQIRNPIASIGGYVKRLINRLPSSAKNRFYLDQIIHESNRLETMLRRIEEVILIPMPVIKKENVKEVIDEAVNMFSKKTQELDVSIHLETGSLKGDEYFFIDRTLIIKSIIYILENSLDAIIPIKGNEKRTIINLSVFQEDENIKLSISDRGEGISKKNMCKIFEPFFSTRPEKIGLGLTFTKKVIEEHKGTIKISSRLKRGTTVIISIPIDRRRAIRRKLIL